MSLPLDDLEFDRKLEVAAEYRVREIIDGYLSVVRPVFEDSPDAGRLRRFACRCAGSALMLCPEMSGRLDPLLDVAQRSSGLASEQELRFAFEMGIAISEELGAVVQDKRWADIHEIGIEGLRSSEPKDALICSATCSSATACVIRSARLAAAQALRLANEAFRARDSMRARDALLALAKEYIPKHEVPQGVFRTKLEEDGSLKDELSVLPKSVVLHVIGGNEDRAVRRFAFACARMALNVSETDDPIVERALADAERITSAAFDASGLESVKRTLDERLSYHCRMTPESENDPKPNKATWWRLNAIGEAVAGAARCADPSPLMAAASAAHALYESLKSVLFLKDLDTWASIAEDFMKEEQNAV